MYSLRKGHIHRYIYKLVAQFFFHFVLLKSARRTHYLDHSIESNDVGCRNRSVLTRILLKYKIMEPVVSLACALKYVPVCCI